MPDLWDQFDELFPPLDISVVSRAIAERCRQSWEEAARVRTPSVYGCPVAYSYGTFERLYDSIAEYLKMYDKGRSDTLKFYKNELIRMKNITIEPTAVRITKDPNA